MTVVLWTYTHIDSSEQQQEEQQEEQPEEQQQPTTTTIIQSGDGSNAYTSPRPPTQDPRSHRLATRQQLLRALLRSTTPGC